MNREHIAIINKVYEQIKSIKGQGKVATYIPELANVDPNLFGVHMVAIDGTHHGVGDNFVKFSIQSIAKVLSFTMAYNILGESI